MLVRAVRALAWSWLFAACFLILTAYASVWRQRGLNALWELLGPHNLTNILAVALTLAPAFFLYQLAGSLHEKKRGKSLGWSAATVLTVTTVIGLLLLPITMGRNEAKYPHEHGKVRE